MSRASAHSRGSHRVSLGRAAGSVPFPTCFIARIGIIVAVLNQLLVRSGREEQALLTTLAGLIVALMMIIGQIDNLFDTIKSVFGL